MTEMPETAKRLFKEIKRKAKPGDTVTILKYLDRESFMLLRGQDGMPYPLHGLLAEMVGEAAEKAGYKVRYVTASRSGYAEWLGYGVNTPGVRRRYLELLCNTCPEGCV